MRYGVIQKITRGLIATLLFSASMIYGQFTEPDIKINALDGHLRFIPAEENISVSVQLDPVGRNDNADWFLAVNTPFGVFFYSATGWTNLVVPVVQTALQPLQKINLMNFPASVLPSGKYAFYFAVDTAMDGAITWDQLDVDTVELTILDTNLPNDSRLIDALAGGKLNVTNSRGDEISLTFPENSLKESTNITITALNSIVSSPFENNLLPGIVLSPQGLMLEKPARLKVKFATPLTKPESSALFHVKDAQLALPLAERDFSLNELQGDINHFSTINAAGVASKKEILNVVNVIANQSRLDAGWHDTYDTVKGLMEFSAIAQILGSGDTADQAWEEAQAMISADCAAFLAGPIPQDPCGSYKNSFFDRIELLQLLGLENCRNDKHFFSYEVIQERLYSLKNKCDNKKIAGLWHLDSSTESQSCSYAGGVPIPPPEDLEIPYNVQISHPRAEDSSYIEASYSNAIDLIMKGTWNGNTGEFDLSASTEDVSKCGYLFYESDICGETAINCTLVSCGIISDLKGKAADSDVTSIEAKANVLYLVTIEVGAPGLRNQVPYVCKGSIHFHGER